jgi:D-glycero-D-manno-heptose 1,7-bisphosphate phosphatase
MKKNSIQRLKNPKLDLVILAGGKGSRIKKYLKGLPKPMSRFNDKYFIEYIIQNFSKYDFNRIYILAGYRSKNIFKKFDKKVYNFIKIECLKEKKLLGTGGALYVLKKKKVKDFILLNGDTIFDINLNELIKSKKKNTLGSIALIKNNTNKNNKKLNNLKISNNYLSYNKDAKLMNGGIYYFKKDIFKHIDNKNISLENEILPRLINKKIISGKQFNQFFFDIGSPKNFLKANKVLYKHFYKPAVFLDRDGVINYNDGYVFKKKDFKFRPGVIKGLKLLCKNNYYIFIVTNQAGIGKKIFTIDNFTKLHLYIKKRLQNENIFIDNVSFSPFHPNAKIKKYKKNSSTRKPGNLMIEKIKRQWHLNLKKSFMIGDQNSDKICARKSGLYFEFAKKNFYTQSKSIIRKINNYF